MRESHLSRRQRGAQADQDAPRDDPAQGARPAARRVVLDVHHAARRQRHDVSGLRPSVRAAGHAAADVREDPAAQPRRMNIEAKPTPTGFVASVADKFAEIAVAARQSNLQHNGAMRETSALDLVARYIKAAAKTASTLDTSMRLHHPEARPIRAPEYRALHLACGEARRYEPGGWQKQ